MKVKATLNNYQYGSYAYSCLSSKIISEIRVDRNHVDVVWDLDSNHEVSRLLKTLGGKCLMTENNLYIYECVICHKITKGYGNSPQPISRFGFCCDKCNMTMVIPARQKQMKELNSKETTDETLAL